MVLLILSAGFILIPIVETSAFFEPSITPKWMVLFAIVSISLFVSSRSEQNLKVPVLPLSAAFISAIFLGLWAAWPFFLGSVHWVTALERIAFGLLVLLFYSYLKISEKDFHRIQLSILFGSAFVVGVGFYQLLQLGRFPSSIADLVAISSTLGHPNLTAQVVGLGFVVLVSQAMNSRNKITQFLLIALVGLFFVYLVCLMCRSVFFWNWTGHMRSVLGSTKEAGFWCLCDGAFTGFFLFLFSF